MQNKVQFMVPRMHENKQRKKEVVEIIPVLLRQSVKGAWKCELTGESANIKRHFNKNYWIMFDNLLGARAHLKACIRRQINALEKEIDHWYDAAERVGVELDENSRRIP